MESSSSSYLQFPNDGDKDNDNKDSISIGLNVTTPIEEMDEYNQFREEQRKAHENRFVPWGNEDPIAFNVLQTIPIRKKQRSNHASEDDEEESSEATIKRLREENIRLREFMPVKTGYRLNDYWRN